MMLVPMPGMSMLPVTATRHAAGCAAGVAAVCVTVEVRIVAGRARARARVVTLLVPLSQSLHPSPSAHSPLQNSG